MLKTLMDVINIQFFASTLEAAYKYVQEPTELETTFKYASYTNDLLDDSATFDGVKYVKYQHIEFGALEPGSYSFANGYTKMDVHTSWKTLELTQDIGDSLSIEKIEDEQAMGTGIVRFVNRYIQRIQAPAVDKYRLKIICAKKNTFAKLLTLTKDNIITEVLHAESRLEDARIDTDALILYIKSGTKAILKEAALAKGYWSMGNWNGNLEVEVEMVDKCKLVTMPADLFPTGVQAVILHKDVAPAWVKYAETVIHDKIPGHGNRKIVADVGTYHDLIVYDELARGIYIFGTTAATKYGVTYAGGSEDAVAKGEVPTAPTQADAVPDSEFTLAAKDSYTLAGKTFVGWSDGTHLYPAGYNYVMPGNAVTLTAIWN